MTKKELMDYLAGFNDEDEVKVGMTPNYSISCLAVPKPEDVTLEEPKVEEPKAEPAA